ncbi:MAG: response regulator transcription factor [Phycisphaerae bacterium]
MSTILLIDDDHELYELLSEYLKQHGFTVEAAHDGETGLRLAQEGQFKLIVLDVMLPGMDGFDVLRALRTSVLTPVMMLTARGEDVDRIIGLEMGADDYLAKPFNPRELVARIRAILRRCEQRDAIAASQDIPKLVVEDVEIDRLSREVRQDGHTIRLTAAEYDLLELLVSSAGHVVDRHDLFRKVLGRDPEPLDRSIDMHVSHLRKKLGAQHAGVERIKSIRGVGYLYTLPDASS